MRENAFPIRALDLLSQFCVHQVITVSDLCFATFPLGVRTYNKFAWSSWLHFNLQHTQAPERGGGACAAAACSAGAAEAAEASTSPAPICPVCFSWPNCFTLQAETIVRQNPIKQSSSEPMFAHRSRAMNVMMLTVRSVADSTPGASGGRGACMMHGVSVGVLE